MIERTAETTVPSAQRSSLAAETRALPTTYTNYFRASGSAEELILDFGLDAHRHADGENEPIVILQRLVLTWGHAQRLARILNELLQRHQQTHGPLANTNRPPTPPS